MEPVSIGLALVAGVLSTLSPCVLPLLPAILIGARTEHRYGPLALAGGLALSFTVLGLFVATIGFALGLTADLIRTIGGAVMIGLGLVLVLPAAQLRVAALAAPVQTFTEQRFGRISTSGIKGQFGLGLLLGAVWAPCVGPTLGAASLLAAQGDDLAIVALVMLAFGLGAAVPILVIAMLSRQAAGLTAWGRRFAGQGKLVLGALFVVFGLLIVTGLDKQLEASLVEISPAWLTSLTTTV
ncbi:cytochrome c biogenesis CcdA family protein [Devosia sp.]|uniref:cytochrome c biogenesis CcdA family protein n=1 Tax=Devosia sp. TaxID=1871048 RepID=UPI003A8EFF0D